MAGRIPGSEREKWDDSGENCRIREFCNFENDSSSEKIKEECKACGIWIPQSTFRTECIKGLF
jgi:hypothetical protein